MSNKKILILPGDGIGNEVMSEVLKIINWMAKTKSISFDISERLVGGTAYDKEGDSISDETMQIALESDAVLFGAVGGSKWDDRITRLRIKQAFGRLVRHGDDKGVFVMLDSRMPSRLLGAFPEKANVERVGLKDAVSQIRTFLDNP